MSLQIAPTTPAIGAELTGIDLTGEISDDQLAAIHGALMKHQVVFFRDQPMTPTQQAGLARRLGRTRVAKKAAFDTFEGVPEMAVLENDEARPPNVNHFHTDGIYRTAPEFASMLRAVDVPQAGGDTIWASLAAAYDALTDDMKVYLEGKEGLNEFMHLHGSPKKTRSWKGEGAKGMERMRELNPPVVHPLVQVHPVTGRKGLYLCESFTTHILDVGDGESRGMLDFLFRHLALPEFQCRFQWRPGSVALWDNRACLHYAVADYWPEHRLMHRVTIESDTLGAWDPGQAAIERAAE